MTLNELLKDRNKKDLIVGYSNKCYTRYNMGIIEEFEDFQQNVYVNIMKSLKNFDEKRSSINTFLCLVIETYCLKSIQINTRKKRDINVKNSSYSIDDDNNGENLNLLDILEDNSSDVDINEKIYIEFFANNLKDKLDKEIFYMLLNNYSVREIGIKLNKTPRFIETTKVRIRRNLKEYRHFA